MKLKKTNGEFGDCQFPRFIVEFFTEPPSLQFRSEWLYLTMSYYRWHTLYIVFLIQFISSPYSKFPVGAALLTDDDTVILGEDHAKIRMNDMELKMDDRKLRHLRLGGDIVIIVPNHEEVKQILSFTSGINCENASYGGTICAERAAVTSAVTRGYRKFRAIAIGKRRDDSLTKKPSRKELQ
ncbi:hypothetical protein DICVIV_10467 [Dictyocaulus viviparus]|uniref:Uncharacterized protein n=1 Tax=Dictyocaulus viviparus TaxID=29172 RepID=A0A0D8XFQ6_DICVI|nr:hypothetical protein DICVIV_10467 [Dictyocaulus viviparus]